MGQKFGGPRRAATALALLSALLFPQAAAAQIDDKALFHSVLLDVGYNLDDRGGSIRWEGQAWLGTDEHKVVLKSEGERIRDEFEEAEVQLLYSRMIDQWWDLQAGIRRDFIPRGTTFGVLGIQGLAPYMFEVDAALFVSDDGHVSARVELEYDIYITQRLVVVPNLTLDFSANRVASRDLGRGLSEVDGGLRVHYLVTREFSPFVDVRYSRLVGETAHIAKAENESLGEVRLIVGVRLWF